MPFILCRQLIAHLKILHELTLEGNAQFIIATHSPILLGYPEASIFSFDYEALTEVRNEDTEHYQITKYFLNAREKMLKELEISS